MVMSIIETALLTFVLLMCAAVYCYAVARLVFHAYFKAKLHFHMLLTRMIKHGGV